MKALERILCVEDEPDIRTITQFALEQVGGFSVQTCASGEDALIEMPHFKPQLILLDVMMPGMDGPETLKAIRKLPDFVDTPVAFMTAKVQASEIAHFISLGAVDVIPKPFDPTTLPQQVQDIWRRATSEG